ncbi:hypothetical protein ORI20_18150 [Mycobacterium sp. CVI_P3]|uniref:Type VII secretion protein EccE n=1 Tax=Mycobacterium pinniadriaticum TaxID=2994102 RepID=A0ABT3SGQ7_9MYCO|nr:hypothetical protein [Mycobacterium pinniadriaticum]MCX2932199.1 hypothetical protein [Mycobacterium pinniadriaticum]MCX2938701.1 hypothetical protein [Mycobacterium pinniadriaticum]
MTEPFGPDLQGISTQSVGPYRGAVGYARTGVSQGVFKNGRAMDRMAIAGLVLAVMVGILGAAALIARARRRRARFDALLGERGWTRLREGDCTTVRPEHGDWEVRTTRSFAAQQSPPSTHIVVSTWASAWPGHPGGAVLAGPSPPGPMRDMAIGLIGSLDGPLRGWLGLTRVGGGARLRPLSSADPRLLVLATVDGEVPGLAGVADAVSTWCARYGGERDQPAVTLDTDGVTVRVRSDAMHSPERLLAFVELGMACRTALAE